MTDEIIYEGARGGGKSTAVRAAREAERGKEPLPKNTATERRAVKAIAEAKQRAKRLTPKPNPLTWCLRQDLHYRYGWAPYY